MARVALDLLLAPPPGLGRRAGLQEALRQAIRCGALQAGTRLPSSRVLAADLGLSRGTVVDAYDQLTAEGWLTTRPAAATIVAAAPHADPADLSPMAGTAGTDRLRHDLRPGRPEAGSFPATAWAAAVRTAIARAPDDAWDYGHRTGRPELRRALAIYLGRVHGVLVDPDRIVVCAGFSGGLALLASLLPAGAPVAAEATTLASLRAVLRQHGHPVMPIPVDAHGAVTEVLDQFDPVPAAVLVTPAHQYPVGGTLDPARRHQLLQWARRHHAVVIEDDYDGEFRYDRQPVGALQALDPDRVVYGGTASKTLAPALRLGWLALPPDLADELAGDPSPPSVCPVSVVDQLALAELIQNGAYDRHVRRMRLRYRRRRDELLRRLDTAAPRATVTGIDAGLHAVVRLPAGTSEAEVLAQCAAHQVAVVGLHGDGPGSSGPDRGNGDDGEPQGITVGYGAPAAHAFGPAIDALGHALSAAGLGR